MTTKPVDPTTETRLMEEIAELTRACGVDHSLGSQYLKEHVLRIIERERRAAKVEALRDAAQEFEAYYCLPDMASWIRHRADEIEQDA